jgi:polyhydroxyalkanoate synthesis regulator phasin
VVPAGSEGTVELFVESGGTLEVHLTVDGPLTKGWGEVPEETSKTETMLDEIVSNGHMSEENGVEDFEDSFLYTFNTPDSATENGDVYRACVCNDQNHLVAKSVQFDFRARSAKRGKKGGMSEGGGRKSEGGSSSRTGAAGDKSAQPIKLVSNPAQLTPEEQKKESERQEEVANLEASIKRLKAGLRRVQAQQQQERHRQAVHAAVNEDSNNRMVVGSLIETVVFIGTAIFQILFVRQWFEGRGAAGGKGAGQWA